MTVANSYLRQQILNQRYIRTLQRQNKRQLLSMLQRINAMILMQPNSERLKFIMSDIEKALTDGFKTFNAKILNDATQFALADGEFTGKVFRANSKVLLRVPEADIIEYALRTNIMDVGTKDFNLTLGKAIEDFADGQSKLIRQIISDGILFGETLNDMTKKISALANGRSAAQVEALTRTSINFANSTAKKSFAIANADAFDGEEYMATLDQRTTTLCGGLDGQVFKVGEGVYPPTHWNCRSVRVPVLKRSFQKSDQRTDRANFDEWLKGQSAEYQDEYFSQFADGSDKAKLFRSGGLEVQQYRDSKGRNYSLDELKALYPLAFDKAGI